MSAHILLVLDEAGNAQLIGGAGHELRAFAECRKMRLTIHALLQSPIAELFTNCRIHEWYYAASAAVERKGIEDLGDSDLSPPLSQLGVGERWVKNGTRVYFDRSPMLESAFIYPELTERRVRDALKDIRNRPEYGEASCSTGNSGDESSSPSPRSTSAQHATFSDSSPARRLRTARSRSSTTRESCDSSAK